MARRTKEEAEQTRRQLLATALRLFSEQGIANVTLSQIAEQAGLSRGAFYWHFTDKAEIVEALWEQEFPLQSVFANIDAEHDDPVEALRQIGCDYLRAIVANDKLQQICRISQQACFDPKIRERWQHLCREEEQHIGDIVEIAQRRGLLRNDLSPPAVALALAGFFQGVVDRWLITANDVDLLQEAERISSIFFSGLKPGV